MFFYFNYDINIALFFGLIARIKASLRSLKELRLAGQKALKATYNFW